MLVSLMFEVDKMRILLLAYIIKDDTISICILRDFIYEKLK